MFIATLILIGLCAGALSGMFGVGGGIIIVPALAMLLAFDQKTAQGTSLAVLVLPVAAVAAQQYYKAGNMDIRSAAIIAVAFVVGSYFASSAIGKISDGTLKRGFGLLLAFVAGQMLLGDTASGAGKALWGAGGVATALFGGWLKARSSKEQ